MILDGCLNNRKESKKFMEIEDKGSYGEWCIGTYDINSQ